MHYRLIFYFVCPTMVSEPYSSQGLQQLSIAILWHFLSSHVQKHLFAGLSTLIIFCTALHASLSANLPSPFYFDVVCVVYCAQPLGFLLGTRGSEFAVQIEIIRQNCRHMDDLSLQHVSLCNLSHIPNCCLRVTLQFAPSILLIKIENNRNPNLICASRVTFASFVPPCLLLITTPSQQQSQGLSESLFLLQKRWYFPIEFNFPAS